MKRFLNRSPEIVSGTSWLLSFWAMQVLLTVIMKLGAMWPGWYLACQAAGMALSILTTWLLMRVFAYFPAHLAQALGIGLSFLLTQVALAAVVRTWLTLGQWAGILAIVGGVFLLSEQAVPKEG